jgi:endonuclease/exonuclease/phosphatase family metal-dependent hydrolase
VASGSVERSPRGCFALPNYFSLQGAPDSARIVAGLQRLRTQLERDVPPRSMDKTLRLATWNIREFDSPAYGPRIPDSFYYIAEIMSRFDLVAVQEVRRDLSALRRLMELLGYPWKYLVTDTTEGDPGNDERLAFLYDSRKVRFSGLSGELVLPDIKVRGQPPVRVGQVARTPFTASFQAGWVTFQLATVHIVYGEDKPDDSSRVAEIKALATFLADRVKDPFSASPNLVLLGDFNIFDTTDSTMTALTDAGWTIPAPIRTLPSGSNIPRTKHYDQIAVLPVAHQFQPAGPAGIFHYYESVFRGEDRPAYVGAMGPAYEKTSKGVARTEAGKAQYYLTYWRTFQMSDHLPMWMDLKIDFSDEYIAGLAPAPPPAGGQNIL